MRQSSQPTQEVVVSEKSEKSKAMAGRKGGRSRADVDVLRDAPPGIMRLIAGRAKMHGPDERGYLELVRAIANDVGAASTIDYLAITDVVEATFDIFRLRKAKRDIVERMRERYRDDLALDACRTASMQKKSCEMAKCWIP
jgi:hypothetical protein